MSHNHFLGFFFGSFQNNASRIRHKEDLPIKTLFFFPTKDPSFGVCHPKYLETKSRFSLSEWNPEIKV